MKADLFIVDDLRLLMEHEGKWCASLFMPTRHVTSRVQENYIRYKNLLREVETKLVEVKAEGTEKALESAYRLLDDYPFWHSQSYGMALFMSEDLFRPYRVPLHLQELVVVADRFHVKPLLPLLSGDGRFYLLALSQGEVRLFECTRHKVNQVDLEGVPLSLDEALKYDELEKQLQFHTRAAGAKAPRRVSGPGLKPGSMKGTASEGRRPAMFHGHGATADDSKDQIRRFFQALDKGLQRTIQDTRAPLVIAAVDYLVPIFKEASTYPTIVDEIISGNPEGVLPQDLHEHAVKIAVPYFEREMTDHVDLYRQLIGTGRASNVVEEVVKAAYHGRVETLFIPVGIHQWGTYDPATDEVILRQSNCEPGCDLLDFAAVQTLLNSGSVYARQPDQMPDRAPVAAIFRY